MDEYMELRWQIKDFESNLEEIIKLREEIFQAKQRIDEIKHNLKSGLRNMTQLECSIYGKSVFTETLLMEKAAKLEDALAYKFELGGIEYDPAVVDRLWIQNAEQTAERSADNTGADSATLDKGKHWIDPRDPDSPYAYGW